MDNDPDDNLFATLLGQLQSTDLDEEDDWLGIGVNATQLMGLAGYAAGMCVLEMAETQYSKQPYHTCPFRGIDWVRDLLDGHPDRIHHELGVRRHIFNLLFRVLQKLGYTDSKHVTLEEQLAIFLYSSVTGLSSRHVGERFQRSHKTISK